jgi:hypothetical protein
MSAIESCRTVALGGHVQERPSDPLAWQANIDELRALAAEIRMRLERRCPRDLEARNSKTLHVNFDTAPARATPLSASAVARVRVGVVPPV